MFEIWGVLKTDDHKATAVDMQEALSRLLSFLQKRCSDLKLGATSEYIVDVEVQRLMLNMDAVGCFMAIQEALHDLSRGAPEGEITALVLLCNEVICTYHIRKKSRKYDSNGRFNLH